jgi:monoamine oxidase
VAYPSVVDLVIVGAGAAGVGAGLAAQAAQLSFVIVEASARVGGRAYTDTTSIGLPWDHGCHWLHSASRNPLTPLALAHGLRVQQSELRVALHNGVDWVSDAECAAFVAAYDAVNAAGAAAGLAADGDLGPTLPGDSPWAGALASWVMQASGRPAATLSSRDHAHYEAHDTHENWPIQDGYGTLIARLAADLPITLNTPVERIRWDGGDVQVETAQGTLRARAVIITASTSVLAADGIGFDPPLPAWKRDALAAAPLGSNNKVAMRFEQGALDGVAPDTFALTTTGDGTAFWLRPGGQPVAIALLSGPLCAELGAQGAQTSIAHVQDHLRALFGSQVVRQIAQVGVALWTEQPFIRGSYSGCLPGQAHQRPLIGRPIDEQLYFAGEATSSADYSTAHGAFQSGRDAVAAVVASGRWA